MIVTVSGEIGAGKSTVARSLARALHLRHLSAGEVFRQEAQRRGVSLAALGRLAEQDPSIDKALDDMQVRAAQGGDILVESRLSGWLIDGDLRIWLKAPLPVRAARVASRDSASYNQALGDIQEREECERRRYRAIYGVDLGDLARYHVVLDTSIWTADDIVDVLLRLARLLQRERSGRPS
jgi:CMP/dCMP kinase